MTERKIELTWVCTSCTHRNRGRDKLCQQCGNPKDASEHFEMPGDTRAAASVTDPSLLRAASAGRDWRCTFCRADNRALDAACKQCGAGRDGTPPIARPPSPASAPALGIAPRSGPPRALWALLLAPAALGGMCLVALFFVALSSRRAPEPYMPPAPSIASATVESRTWHTSLVAMRHRLVEREGFAEQQPPDAIDVVPDGVRHHHDDQVPDGTMIESYTEDVPYQDTETYTEMVACGEDCTAIPQSCHEECTDDGNGFATCHDVCSGGGQTCTPRTCPETRTRVVTRTRPEPRTRTVPRFRSEPRDAPWFHWRTWAWVEDRRAEHDGTSEAPSWPTDEELGTGTPLGEGEEERVDRDSRSVVTLRDERGGVETIVPTSIEELATYPTGRVLRVELDPYGTFVRAVE